MNPGWGFKPGDLYGKQTLEEQLKKSVIKLIKEATTRRAQTIQREL